MIRAYCTGDLDAVLRIWMESNVKAHAFIPASYWEEQAPAVREVLPQAEVYVYEDGSREILGFLGLTGDYIAGLFVREDARSRGIGSALLRHAKDLKPRLELHVYQKNDRAAGFYQREGFAVQAEQTDEPTGERELCMVWNKTHSM